MKNFIDQVATSIKEAADKTTQAVSEVMEHENTQAALEWTKKSANTLAEEATRLGKEVVRSDMVKDVATGAAIGAVVVTPIPLVGPIAGAVVGSGLGLYKNLTRPSSSQNSKSLGDSETNKLAAPPIDVHDELTKLHDLLTKQIITEAEFAEQKSRILDHNRK